MSFPIKAKDLEKNQASNDEEALFIAVEAILDGDFEKLAFSKKVDVVELKNRITNDPKFEEVRGLIAYEKNLLTSIVANNEAQHDIAKLMEIQRKTLHEFNENNQPSKHSNFAKFSVAASVIMVITVSVLSFSYVVNNKSSATKSSSKSTQNEKTTDNNSISDESSGSGDETNPSVVSREGSGIIAENAEGEPTTSSEVNEVAPSDALYETNNFIAPQSTPVSPTKTSFVEKYKHSIINVSVFLLVLLIILLFRFAFKKREYTK